MPSYRLLNYQSSSGPRSAIAVGNSVHDLASAAGREDYRSMLDVLADWPAARTALHALADELSGKSGMPMAELRILAPVLYPSAIYCAGANYSDHAANMAKLHNLPLDSDPRGSGKRPWHFIKASRCIVGPGAKVSLPCEKLDWEVELAAVIGETVRNVPESKALDVVAGFTAANDLSARDLSRRPGVSDSSPFKYDWIGQKCFDGACPMGPWLIPAAEIPDPQKLALKLWVNDSLRQDSNTSRMIFSVAEQIAYLSSRITLYPGDVILTGTPAGVGAETGVFLKRGDTVKLSVESIGELVTRIA